MHLTAVLPVMAKIKGERKKKHTSTLPTTHSTSLLLLKFFLQLATPHHMPPLLTTTNISMQLLFFLLEIFTPDDYNLDSFFFFFSNVEENHRWCYFRQTFTFPVMDSLKNCNALLQKWISYYTLANASSFVSRME